MLASSQTSGSSGSDRNSSASVTANSMDFASLRNAESFIKGATMASASIMASASVAGAISPAMKSHSPHGSTPRSVVGSIANVRFIVTQVDLNHPSVNSLKSRTASAYLA